MTFRDRSHARGAHATRAPRRYVAAAVAVLTMLVLSAERRASAQAVVSAPSPVDLGTLGGSFAVATKVNDAGMVIGYSALPGDVATHTFVWTRLTGMVDIGTLGGNFTFPSFPDALNENGMVAGSSTLAGDAVTHAFAWTRAGGMIDLGTLGGSSSLASGINARGTIVGSSTLAGDVARHAFVWTEADGIVDIGTLGGSF